MSPELVFWLALTETGSVATSAPATAPSLSAMMVATLTDRAVNG
jgi:hypothetical protein